MRNFIIAAAFALSGCATAVNDSLERRGVDSGAVFAERLEDARAAMTVASTSFAAAAAALAAVEALDGPALARQSTEVRAAGQDAALAAQDLRLSLGSAGSAGERYFRDKENELTLIAKDQEAREAAASKLAATHKAWRAFETASDAAALRLSPALSLYDAEATALRRDPTSGLAAAARARSRAGALSSVSDVLVGLDAAIRANDDLRAALK